MTPQEQLEFKVQYGQRTIDGIYETGDPVEVQQGGYWTDPVHGRKYRVDRFTAIRINNIKLEDALYLMNSDNSKKRMFKYNNDLEIKEIDISAVDIIMK
jgi:hypothetical protein